MKRVLLALAAVAPAAGLASMRVPWADLDWSSPVLYLALARFIVFHPINCLILMQEPKGFP